MTPPDGDPAQSAALALLIGAGCLLALSGAPGLLFPRLSPWGPRLATGLALAGSLAGLVGGALALAGTGSFALDLPSPMPGQSAWLAADALSGFFALPVFLVGGLGALYGSAYWAPRHHPKNGRRLRFCYGLLLASLVFITLARDGIAFLIAWEVMALTNFFLVTTDEHDPSVRGAGWLYLLYSHVTILGLFALFLLEYQATGGFAFAAIPAAAPAGLRTGVFVLALLAFGIKAGAMPLHSWLPAAHASAPSHVSALMSGVVIKIGIYGLVRTTSLLPAPPLAWGVALLAIGCLSAFFGVVFALAQHDLKRLLAYHSIENIGIILLGLGLALVGRSLDRPEWVLLGLAGCLLHVWNHALFKSLLFFGAGSVAHATGSRDLEKAGGLARRMPATATLFLLGSLAICGLPPGNGFVSELLVYLGLGHVALAPGAAWAALAVPVLAATGALAVACFVKVVGVVFLGTPRTAAAEGAHESPPLMLAPMAVLAACCLLLGVAPGLVAPALERAVAVWAGGSLAGASLAELAPLGAISASAVALLAGVALLAAAVAPACRRGRRRLPALPTWDCGYAGASPRLQYTASSFAQLITSRFAWALRPTVHAPRVEGLFPGGSRFHSHTDDSVLEGVLRPAARGSLRLTALLRSLPQGQLQRYILYILGVLLALLVWAWLFPS
ncbi:MAG TPA: proton-conducting transporter membrane subunit [Thermoanaerobaculia bacterium]|nr:proton-conducting transporter membrane subunit [Thermoanaerobaculia bacterium]